MLHMIDFLSRQFASFEELPFCALDAAALSQVAMVKLEDTVPPLPPRSGHDGLLSKLKHDAWQPVHLIDSLKAEHYDTMFADLLSPDKAKAALFGVAASPRYRKMVAFDYQSIFDEQSQNQFGAIAFAYEDLFTCVAFRGTDTSLAGWREDFNMAFTMPVPAQDQALEYLEAVAAQRQLPKPLYVVGHSKGGNLAEYAALSCSDEVRDRIEHVYNLDGPGFKKGTFTSDDYERLSGRITKIIPEDSMVGILLYSDAPTYVAATDAKGLDAHSAFAWYVNDEMDGFVFAKDVVPSTKSLAVTLHEWLAGYDDAQRREMTDAFFDALKVTGAKNPVEFLAGGAHGLSLLLQAARKLDKHERAVLLRAARSFVDELSKNAKGSLGIAASAASNIVDRIPMDDPDGD